MKTNVQMIGTGSAFAKRFYNNNAIITSDHFRLLIDCGITAPLALHHAGIELTEIDGILITHIHADHIGGLEEIAFRMKFVHNKKPKLYVSPALADPLWHASLRGGLEDSQGGSDSLSSYFDVGLIDAHQPISLAEDLVIELIPTKHIPGKPSFALLINETLFYSSDMTFDGELLTNLLSTGRCKHIMHDCQLTGKGDVHTTLAELLTLPESIQEHIWLMHYGDNMDQFIGKTGRMKFIEQQRVYSFT